MRNAEDSGTFLAPALLTGTSAEFMGKKPLPRLVSERRMLFVLGPSGVGKSTVARVLCTEPRDELDTPGLAHRLIERVRLGAWPDEMLEDRPLVIDGPVGMRHRPSAVALLLELARQRALKGYRTVFCQTEPDGSVEELITQCEPGWAVVVGLRFPSGRKSRLRTARQICADLGLPPSAAEGTEHLDPWRYDRLMACLIERAVPDDGLGGTE
ncbi:MAG: hypothetical protein H6735_12725 [Alphaproteobacteria bacterium]|nr:hypothetical protein [Alphaproteobacteria bacterium]